MRKILIILLLALVAIVIFAGCNKSNDAETTVAATQTDVTTEESTTSTPDVETSADTTDTESSDNTTETQPSEDTTEFEFIDGTTCEEIISGEEPLAPTEYELIGVVEEEEVLSKLEAPCIVSLIRTAEEFESIKRRTNFETDVNISFDTHSIVCAEIRYTGVERIKDFYGFDVVNGKVCPIATFIRTCSDMALEGYFGVYYFISVKADSIAGRMGQPLVADLSVPGSDSRCHDAYIISAPSEIDWCLRIPSNEPQNWNYDKDFAIIRSQSELDAYGIGISDCEQPFSFEENWLVLTRFRLASSDENVKFYGFAVNDDGEVCPVISVEAPEFNTEDELEAFFLVCIPKDSISGKLGRGLAYNTLREGEGSAYHDAYIPQS
jgi:hypothetical protein